MTNYFNFNKILIFLIFSFADSISIFFSSLFRLIQIYIHFYNFLTFLKKLNEYALKNTKLHILLSRIFIKFRKPFLKTFSSFIKLLLGLILMLLQNYYVYVKINFLGNTTFL